MKNYENIYGAYAGAEEFMQLQTEESKRVYEEHLDYEQLPQYPNNQDKVYGYETRMV